MAVFALTGDFCSGKSSVAALLKKKKAAVFDCDRAVHAVYRDKSGTVYKSIVRRFKGAVTPAGNISRRRLGAIVFADPSKLDCLEKIVHPAVIGRLKAWIAQRKKNTIAIAEVPLLFEAGLSKMFTGVIVVKSSSDVIKKRALSKRGIGFDRALQRINRYMPIREKIKQADFVVENDGTLAQLAKSVDRLWKSLQTFV